MIQVRDVTVAYHQKTVLEKIQWTVDVPCLLGIVGPNGSGKSTLIKSILGLVPISQGQIQLFGQPIDRVRRRIGYVPQRESVDWDFPVSVLDVVLMGTYGRLGWFRRPGRAERTKALDCLREVGLSEFADRQIGELSGGQQQRTFLARALAQDADLYFMDEPMAGVDAATEQTIFALLKRLRQSGKTIILVHHDLRTVPDYFDRVLILNRQVIASGSTRDAFTAENLNQAYGGRVAIIPIDRPPITSSVATEQTR